MILRERDDMEVFYYEYKDVTYRYRIPDTCISTRDGGKHFNFIVSVYEKDNMNKGCFTVPFRLAADDLYLSRSKAEEGIREYVDAK